MMPVLQNIIDHTRAHVQVEKEQIVQTELQAQIETRTDYRDFASSLHTSAHSPAVIAEYKLASPSEGRIREQPQLETIITGYTQRGAAAISVLTDAQFFQGKLEYITRAKQVTTLPILRKDFIIDPYQIYQSAAAGADAILLIVAILDDIQLATLYQLTYQLQMQAIVEVHTAEELQRALRIAPELIGINTRNLHTMHTDLSTFAELASTVPKSISLIAESGIATSADLQYVHTHGATAALVGTHLMKAKDPAHALATLLR